MSRQKELDSTSSGVAAEVQGFYERYPYPRPIDSLENYRRLWQDRDKRRADYHLFWPAKSYREDHSILIAGSGTSQAAKHALRWPAAQVTGIDFSATSVRCTEQLKRKYSLENLQIHQYATVELFRGTMLSHSFIAYRDDRAGETEPITFVGDRWREYVPIRQPSTVCARERVPPGSVAVLINRAHTFTDLILTVDAAEDRLLGAINGKRTLAEVLLVAGKGCDERRALDFFERLWQYDQVVFDASREG